MWKWLTVERKPEPDRSWPARREIKSRQETITLYKYECIIFFKDHEIKPWSFSRTDKLISGTLVINLGPHAKYRDFFHPHLTDQEFSEKYHLTYMNFSKETPDEVLPFITIKKNSFSNIDIIKNYPNLKINDAGVVTNKYKQNIFQFAGSQIHSLQCRKTVLLEKTFTGYYV